VWAIWEERAVQYLEEAALLRQQGHRLTPQRLQVLQVIKAHSQHITAEEIHAAIVPQQPFIDIATVYRTLQWLQTVGLVAPISTGEGKLYYEYHAPGEHHHHLICQQCSQHIQIPDTDLAGLKHDLLERYGFTLQIDHLALLGRCGGCIAEDEAH
jgi:Fur family ferric uptake transcriptional regulator